jgi:hypothetical protein
MAVYLFLSEGETIAVGQGSDAEQARAWAIASTRLSAQTAGASTDDIAAQVARIRTATPERHDEGVTENGLDALLRRVFRTPPKEAKR